MAADVVGEHLVPAGEHVDVLDVAGDDRLAQGVDDEVTLLRTAREVDRPSRAAGVEQMLDRRSLVAVSRRVDLVLGEDLRPQPVRLVPAIALLDHRQFADRASGVDAGQGGQQVVVGASEGNHEGENRPLVVIEGRDDLFVEESIHRTGSQPEGDERGPSAEIVQVVDRTPGSTREFDELRAVEGEVVLPEPLDPALRVEPSEVERWLVAARQEHVPVGGEIGDDALEQLGAVRSGGDLVHVVEDHAHLGRAGCRHRVPDRGEVAVARQPERCRDAAQEVGAVAVARLASDPDIAPPGGESILLDGLGEGGRLAEARTGPHDRDPGLEAVEEAAQDPRSQQRVGELRWLGAKRPTHPDIHGRATVPLIAGRVQCRCHPRVTDRTVPARIAGRIRADRRSSHARWPLSQNDREARL